MNLTSTIQNYLRMFVAFSLAATLAIACTTFAQAATIGWNQSAAGTFDYNDPNNWVGGDINGIWDISNTIPSSQTITFGANTVLSTGLTFEYDGSANETLRGTGADRTITLGGDITHNTVSTTRVITLGSTTANQALNIDLGGTTRTFTVGSGRTLGFVNAISNGSIIASGGTLNFSGANTYSGTTTITSGNFSLNGTTGSSANSDFTVKMGSGSTSTLTFNSGTSGNTGTTRANSVTLNGVGSSTGVFLNSAGNSGANSIETISNALAVSGGFNTVSLSANAARNVRLAANNFVRTGNATVLFRGNDLGVSSIASQTAGDTNIWFSVAPTLTGAGGPANSTTLSLLKGAFGDLTSSGSGINGGLVTYDSTNGVRLLNTSTEYQAAITNGQSQLDNVLYARTSGSASQDFTLTNSLTTINSLSFKITGAGTNSGVTLGGDPGTTLRLNSGMIFASQSVTTAAASDAMTINVPTLDLNGQEGVFIVFSNGINNGNTPAPLQINSVIANDGGNGVTISGTGEVIYGGAVANTYTGPTVVNSGILRLSKTVANIGLTSDLILNGGNLLKNSNSIADTANVTINGGTFWMDSTTSSGNNGHSETINNFTMNGGGFGNHGTSASFTINGNATLTASQLGMNQGGDITVLGTTNLSGGTLVTRDSTSTSVINAFTSLQNVNITNTAADPYTAMILTSNATNRGGQVTLNGNLTFTGNGTNSNTVRIDSSDISLANQGVIALEGTRTFNIGNGAAAVDLAIAPALVNGAATGSFIKSGNGTLALGGVNTYSGSTAVNAGTLLIDGALQGTSGVTVAANARLGGTGSVFTTVGGAGSIDPGNSPGIMTVTQVDPSSGLDFNFEFTQANALPTWSATENDVLRVMAGTPFTQTMNSNNVISLYLDVNSLSFGDVLYGGFYTDGGDVLSDLQLADVVAYLEDANGSVSYLGKNYNPILNGYFTLSTLADSQFAPGGYLTQFTFNPAPAPEPSSALLLGLGVVMLGSLRRKRRQK